MTDEQLDNWLGNRDIGDAFPRKNRRHKVLEGKEGPYIFVLHDGCIDAFYQGCMYGEVYDDRNNSEGTFDNNDEMEEWVKELDVFRGVTHD